LDIEKISINPNIETNTRYVNSNLGVIFQIILPKVNTAAESENNIIKRISQLNHDDPRLLSAYIALLGFPR
jgi:hypothetical protein